jgi:hypothetical protein
VTTHGHDWRHRRYQEVQKLSLLEIPKGVQLSLCRQKTAKSLAIEPIAEGLATDSHDGYKRSTWLIGSEQDHPRVIGQQDLQATVRALAGKSSLEKRFHQQSKDH